VGLWRLSDRQEHWRRFLPGASRLSPDQRRDSAGLAELAGAESSRAGRHSQPDLVPIVALPTRHSRQDLTLPIIASFVVSWCISCAYRPAGAVNGASAGAMVTAMSVQWTVSRAGGQWIDTEHLAFARTSKGRFSADVGGIPGVLGKP